MRYALTRISGDSEKLLGEIGDGDGDGEEYAHHPFEQRGFVVKLGFEPCNIEFRRRGRIQCFRKHLFLCFSESFRLSLGQPGLLKPTGKFQRIECDSGHVHLQ